ncbi:M20/M25/M40 family metallo-hydrolase [Pontibacter sp. 172403-2]|uniref:M20/M25/M40 family metallo-hydrolase n=1 Tax=Pontibacter rufus TaxID=2791028 RepID=UPI0018AFF521|nr:M20/M25/M40 family metallo-hydrolase [Pontibacter sp. 172403-2]MBF9252793.1 M20/M25/M40 family metallo-hydrolase [Pontibacter sp. 172403-2]
MIKNIILLAALALSFGTVASAQDLKTITQQETTRLVKTLSADNMQGRASFSPGNDKAASFIAGEFKRIGLAPLPGDDDFLQTFKVYRLTPDTKKASLNGTELPSDAFFASTTQQQLTWSADQDRTVIVIGETEDFGATARKLMKEDQDALVLVNPKHRQPFNGFKNYMARGSMATALDKGADLVFILTDQTTADNYKIEIENNIVEQQLTNVAGRIKGKRQDEIVVFSGHYDHIGIGKPVANDSIANGADDDASGTTAVIMLAAYYKKQPKPERTLVFVAFTAEEIGGYGSRYFSEQLDPDNIVAMFNIEMVGKPSKFGPNSAFLTGYEKSDMGQLLQKRLEGTAYSIHPDPYPEQNLFYRSDNATLARLGVPAHTISSDEIDKDAFYHTVNDEFETLDMAHLTNMIKAIALASQGIVRGEDTPTRVDKTQVK